MATSKHLLAQDRELALHVLVTAREIDDDHASDLGWRDAMVDLEDHVHDASWAGMATGRNLHAPNQARVDEWRRYCRKALDDGHPNRLRLAVKAASALLGDWREAQRGRWGSERKESNR